MDSRGFSLIELVVVVAIIAMMAVVGLPTVSNYFRVSLNSATRELASSIKQAYNATMVTGRVHRLAYDLKENQFWVESGPATVLLDTPKTREEAKRKKRFTIGEEAEPSSPFGLAKDITKKKLSLPTGVAFEDVVTEQSPDPVMDGMAYTHFFPHGLTEQTIIHLKDDQKHHSSLVVAPFLGKATLIDRYIKEEEAFQSE